MSNVVSCFVPALAYGVSYRLSKGRPWSPLEWLVLQAVDNGVHSLAALVDLLQVNQRLLIEALVTLTTEGWLAVGRKGITEFEASRKGSDAAVQGQPPVTHLRAQDARKYLVKECLGGELLDGRRVRLLPEIPQQAFYDGCVKLDPDPIIRSERPSVAQVAALIQLRPGEFIDSDIVIGPASAQRWIMVEVDKSLGLVVGGAVLSPSLRLMILDQAGIAAKTGQQARRSLLSRVRSRTIDSALVPRLVDVKIERDDILANDNAHIMYLKRALSQARSACAIASAFVSKAGVARISADIHAALERGVRVDLLGGYESCAEKVRDELDQIRAMSQRGALCYNDVRTDSHAKIVMWDTPNDSFEMCIGSFNWLSTEVRSEPANNVSVATRAPVLSTIGARYVTALWRVQQREQIEARLWERIGLEQAERAADVKPTDANAQARLIIDREHDALFRESVGLAQARLFVASHKMGNPTVSRLSSAYTRHEKLPACHIVYGEAVGTEEVGIHIERVSKELGATLTQVPSLHAKVLIADNRVCVSSYNFLSAGAGDKATPRELGIVIQGWDIGQAVGVSGVEPEPFADDELTGTEPSEEEPSVVTAPDVRAATTDVTVPLAPDTSPSSEDAVGSVRGSGGENDALPFEDWDEQEEILPADTLDEVFVDWETQALGGTGCEVVDWVWAEVMRCVPSASTTAALPTDSTAVPDAATTDR